MSKYLVNLCRQTMSSLPVKLKDQSWPYKKQMEEKKKQQKTSY